MNEALNKQDIQALKLADTVVFHHDRLGDRKNGNSGRIRCIKNTKQAELDKDPYAPQEREYELECDSWINMGHNAVPDGQDSADYREKLRGAEVTWPYPNNVNRSVLSTVIHLLRPEDRLKLKWFYGGESINVEKAGLFQDTLELEVRREQKSGDKLMTFLLRVSVCPDNSARMISSWH